MNYFILLLISTTLLSFPRLKEVNETFNEVSERYDIPKEILKAIAYQKSGWFINNSKNQKDNHGEYGIMGLSMEQIDLGISLLGDGDSIDTIVNYKKNIEASAAIISNLKSKFYKDGIIIKSIEDYADLLVLYSYPKYPLLSKAFTRKVYNTIRNGYDVSYQKQKFRVSGKMLDILAGEYPKSVLFYTYYTDISSLDDVSTHWSPNKWTGRGGNTVDQIIIHIMLGTFHGSESWFMNTNSEVSAHYLISNEGEILQMVRLTDRAWHAGSHNNRSIGIEHEGYWYSPRFRAEYSGNLHDDTLITEAEYQASAMITRWLTERYNIPKIHRDAYHAADGSAVPYQLQRPELSNLSGILGHHDTNGKENCPGGGWDATHNRPYAGGWDWNYYMELVGGGTNDSVGNLTLLTPTNNETVDNPVTFRAIGDGDIVKVKYFADGSYLLGESSNSNDNYKVEYQFTGIGNRNVSAKGYDNEDRYIRDTEVAIEINIIEAGTGSISFVEPINNHDSPNPVILKATATGDVTQVKYYAEGTIFLGESNNSSDNFRVERLFNQPGERVLVARGYTSDGVYVTGAEDIITVNVLEEENCTDTCNTLNEKRCSNGSTVETCKTGSNGCNSWETTDSCSNDEICRTGVCVDNSGCNDECVVGERKCSNDSTAEKCVENNGCKTWQNVDNCSDNETCLSGHCVESNNCTNECTNLGEKRCFGSSIKKCGQFDNDNCLEWREIDSCSDSEVCSEGVCQDNCDNNCYNVGDKKCLGEMIQVCTENNGCLNWVNENNCTGNNICDSGSCVSECTNQCTLDEKRCVGNIIEVCKTNFDTDSCTEWGKLSECTNRGESCNAGSCIKICTDECSELGDIQCDGNLVKVCQKSEMTECYELVTSRKCIDGKVCSRGTCMSSSCVNTCNTYGELTCEGVSVAICTNDADGCLSTTVVESCSSDENYCTSGRCLKKIVGKVCNAGIKICQDENVVLVCNESETEYVFSSNCLENEKCVSGFCKLDPIDPNNPDVKNANDGWCSYSVNNNSNDVLLLLFILFLVFISKKVIIKKSNQS